MRGIDLCLRCHRTDVGLWVAIPPRSPWTNEYIPPIPSGTVPSTKLRNLEQAANDAFAVYREMYYEGTGISSVYLWDLEDSSGTSFAGVVLLKKTSKGGDGQTSGAWDSIHVFEASEKSRQGTYKLTSTVGCFPQFQSSCTDLLVLPVVPSKIMLYMNKAGSETLGDLTLGGSMTRQMEQSYPLDTTASYATTSTSINPSHISNIGRMIEDQEIKMRGLLQDVYFAKTRDVVNDIRILRGAGEESKRKGLQGELVGLLRGRA